MHVLATAGHVDHGKSTLVQALTGIDPDRLSEEKERGLTIDLGFAWTALPSGAEVAFVDVPGHVRFIKNMLAGVGAVDACLFVVAATEGWKPQSEEHLRILSLLGVSGGVIALTKTQLVDDDWRQLAELEVSERVRGTFLEDAEIVSVDAPAGRNLDDLALALDRLVARTPTAADLGRPRLWIDRSFAARGSGTVVTGTLTGGTISIDDELAVEPGGLTARVRGLQTHTRPLPTAGPGRRLAVNLAGLSHDRVRRGQALVRPGQWHLTRTVDASLTVLAGLDHDVSRRGAYAVYLGSGEHPVRLRVLGKGGDRALAAGETGAVRVWLPLALALVPGDRFVLRELGRSQTVGGGEILDVDPVRPAGRAAPDRSVDRVVAERGWVDVAELTRLTGVERIATMGRWVVDPAALAKAEEEVRTAVTSAGRTGLDVATLDERHRVVLGHLADIVVTGGRARPAGAEPAPADLARHPLVAALSAAPFSPPEPSAADRTDLRDLARAGLVVDCGGVWFAASAVTAAAGVIARLLAQSPEGVTVSQVRDALGSSR
ncbi:MAG TPA: selenocysteine-specific translation elongation factor, partial [Acidimicrobiales bacterium]|nr:selenocysteine-specific translation elongation factor [Acidimicrobiales bacterium]